MKCPQCGAPTEVSEKRGPYRQRQCKSSGCDLSFTTTELVVGYNKRALMAGERVRLCARTLATSTNAALGIPVSDKAQALRCDSRGHSADFKTRGRGSRRKASLRQPEAEA